MRYVAHLLDETGEALCGEHPQAWQIPMPRDRLDRDAVLWVYRQHERAKRILASDESTKAQRQAAQRLLASTEPDPSPKQGETVHQCQGCMMITLLRESKLTAIPSRGIAAFFGTTPNA